MPGRSFWHILTLAIGLLMALILLTSKLGSLEQFGHLEMVLLALSALGILLLFVLVGIHILRLLRQLRQQEAGSLLARKLVLMAVTLAILPTAMVYGFSLKLIQYNSNRWFDLRIEKALEDALALSRDTMNLYTYGLLTQTEEASRYLASVSAEESVIVVNELREKYAADEMTLMDTANQIIATSSNSPDLITPQLLADDVLLQVNNNLPYIGLEALQDDRLQVLAVVPLLNFAPQEKRIISALYTVPGQIRQRANNVQEHFREYQRLLLLREPLQLTILILLSLVMLFGALIATWSAFSLARHFTRPIHDLIEGVKAIAKGDYQTRVTLSQRDEFGFLGRLFNNMAQRLLMSQQRAQESWQELERQRIFLKKILDHISTGVLVLNQDGILQAANPAAEQLLHISLDHFQGRHLQVLPTHEPRLQPFFDAIILRLSRVTDEWLDEIEIRGQKDSTRTMVLRCHGARLQDDAGHVIAYVLVFDDISVVMQEQREAAWVEVARRLAHEIKNPLTPIQLSAERLQRHYHKQGDPKSASLLLRSTTTIIQQVEAMKAMVKDFSLYANSTALHISPLLLSQLLQEIADLYVGMGNRLQFSLQLPEKLPLLMADSNRLRQVFHNLIKNALESLPGEQAVHIQIQGKLKETEGTQLLLYFSDNGPGFDSTLIARIFEPYVTSKRHGSGLGLAIVKRIIEQHNGQVRAYNGESGGIVEIQLPIDHTLQEDAV